MDKFIYEKTDYFPSKLPGIGAGALLHTELTQPITHRLTRTRVFLLKIFMVEEMLE